MTDVNEFLDHHGVKGQKWGIRNVPTRKPGQKKAKILGTKNPVTTRTRNEMMLAKAKQSSIKVDETPWSNYHESSYSKEQWHSACLIHNHSGASTSKNQCKLPIKTPNGVVNRHGVYAAAAVLAGSRGGVNASSTQKDSAAKTLINMYKRMGVKPPPSLLLKHSDMEEYLEHYGKRGMHWGIHTEKDFYKTTGDAKRARELKKRPVHGLTNAQLKTVNDRMNLEQSYRRLNPTTRDKGIKAAKEILGTVGIGVTAYEIINGNAGRWAVSLGKRVLGK